jgi:hypothetical protein
MTFVYLYVLSTLLRLSVNQWWGIAHRARRERTDGAIPFRTDRAAPMTFAFRRLAQRTAAIVGHANSFLAASRLIFAWLVTGS